MDAIRLAIVDDHPAIALAVEAALARESSGQFRSIELAWTARTAEGAIGRLRSADSAPPDVVLCDLQLDGRMEGLNVVDAARAAGSRAIVLTSFDRSSFMRAAFDRGAAGFLNKSAEVGEILHAVRTVASGGTAFSAATL